MKRNFVVGTVLSLCTLLAVVPSSWAQSDANIDPICRTWYRRVTTEGGGLNVRDNPNDGRIIGRLTNGTVVLLEGGDRTGTWSSITAPGGLTGWVSERFLSYHHYGNRRFTGTMQVRTLDGGPVNLRRNGEVIARVPNGTLVTAENHNIGYFANVTTPEGLRGEIVTQFLICN